MPDIVIPKPTSQIPVLDAEIALVGKVADAVTDVAQAYIKKEAKENCKGTWDAKNEKCIE